MAKGRLGRSLVLAAALIVALTVSVVPASANTEIWVAPTSQQDLGGLGIASNSVWPVPPSWRRPARVGGAGRSADVREREGGRDSAQPGRRGEPQCPGLS